MEQKVTKIAKERSGLVHVLSVVFAGEEFERLFLPSPINDMLACLKVALSN